MKTPPLLQTRWAALQPREKTLVLASAVLVLAALLWWLALAPALKTLRAAPQQHQALETARGMAGVRLLHCVIDVEQLSAGGATVSGLRERG